MYEVFCAHKHANSHRTRVVGIGTPRKLLGWTLFYPPPFGRSLRWEEDSDDIDDGKVYRRVQVRVRVFVEHGNFSTLLPTPHTDRNHLRWLPMACVIFLWVFLGLCLHLADLGSCGGLGGLVVFWCRRRLVVSVEVDCGILAMSSDDCGKPPAMTVVGQSASSVSQTGLGAWSPQCGFLLTHGGQPWLGV